MKRNVLSSIIIGKLGQCHQYKTFIQSQKRYK